MAAAGVASILVANEVIGTAKLAAAAALAGHTDLVIAVDDAAQHRRPVGRDDGRRQPRRRPGRPGRRHGPLRRALPEQALGLARQVHAAPGLDLRGVQAYEGHCMLEPDRETRIRLATEAMAYAGSVKDLLRADGLPADVLSAGGTGTYNITGRNPAVTELQAGSYVFMDAFHGNLVPGFEVSLTVLTSVLARHGDTVIFDAGRKSVGIDFVVAADPGIRLPGPVLRRGTRAVRHRPRLPRRARRPDAAGLRLRADDREPARRDVRGRGRSGGRGLARLPARSGSLRLPGVAHQLGARNPCQERPGIVMIEQMSRH